MNAIVDIMQTRPCLARRFKADDGVNLAFQHWPTRGDTKGRSVILLHRGHEHSARMAHLDGRVGNSDGFRHPERFSRGK